ncbi:MAG: pimeloyl-ACP methyl ester esterase BioH, partial [Betaproteobacteria bacterium]|nr:pimeloyl-ACP methyl ester esterase BioH [Betaproteobacteria bacterium]
DAAPKAHTTRPNLTLLHGWGLNGAVWQGIRDELAHRYTLHIIDLPGHGRSHHTLVHDVPEMVEAIAHAMPQKTHLLGWSLGGHVALALAHRYPDRVQSLVTVCTTPCFVEKPDWPYGKSEKIFDDFAKRLGSRYHVTIRNFLALQALNQPDIREIVTTLQEAISAQGAPSLAGLTASLSILRQSDIRPLLPEIQQPVLVLHGDHDALTSTSAASWLADHLPHSTFCLIEHAAHAPFLSHPRAFIDHLNAFVNV